MEWTGARYADGPTAEVSTWIDAPPDDVWAAVVDLPAMAESSPELQTVEWLDAGAPGVGSRFVGHSRHEALGEWWQAGDRDGAAALVTDEMVLATTLIGTEDMVRARLRVWRDAGVDTVRLYPAGDTLDDRLTTLARAIELVRSG
jgi:polyketide cyclase/dehydrase/lipid transport protein/luciferase-like monooxygenase